MNADMNQRDLVQMVEKLVSPPSHMTDRELEQSIETFVASISHPAGTDLIYYPEQWGLPADPSAEMIVNEALSWRPRIVAIRVRDVRPHPRRKDLFCIVVELPNSVRSQVVSTKEFQIGDICIVALSGVRLQSGKMIEHGFVDKAYTAGEILGTTDKAPGTEFSAADFPNC